MKKFNAVVVLFAVLLLAGCSTISVVSDYDREFDFSKLETYRWPEKDEGIRKSDVLVNNPLMYKRVQSAVDKRLQARGYRLEKGKKADFIVHAHAGVKRVRSYYPRVGIGFGYRYWPWWGPYGGYTYVSTYEEGSLVLDIISAGDKELAWRGVATGVVRSYRSPEAMQRDIDKAVDKILVNFPSEAGVTE